MTRRLCWPAWLRKRLKNEGAPGEAFFTVSSWAVACGPALSHSSPCFEAKPASGQSSESRLNPYSRIIRSETIPFSAFRVSTINLARSTICV